MLRGDEVDGAGGVVRCEGVVRVRGERRGARRRRVRVVP